MAVRNLEAVQQLSGSAVRAESRPGRIGPISLGAKQTGERRAGNPHAAFDVAGTGNVAWSRCCDTRRRKGETTGNTNIDLNRRASPRPYLCGGRSAMSVPTASDPFFAAIHEFRDGPSLPSAAKFAVMQNAAVNDVIGCGPR